MLTGLYVSSLKYYLEPCLLRIGIAVLVCDIPERYADIFVACTQNSGVDSVCTLANRITCQSSLEVK